MLHHSYTAWARCVNWTPVLVQGLRASRPGILTEDDPRFSRPHAAGRLKEEGTAVKPVMAASAAVEATDEQLVEAARAGSDEAFEALFRRYRDRMTAYVRRIVGDAGRAEDIVQEAFMSALRSMRASDREILFRPWMFQIAKNACIDHHSSALPAEEVSINSDYFRSK
jgi:hypothetical protein